MTRAQSFLIEFLLLILIASVIGSRLAFAALVRTPKIEKIEARISELQTSAATRSIAAKSQSLEDLESLASTIKSEFMRSDPEAFAYLSSRLLTAVSAADPRRAEESEFVQRVAIDALREAPSFSLTQECELLQHLRVPKRSNPADKLPPDEAVTRANEIVSLWLHAWQRLDQALVNPPRPSPAKRPVLSVPPPPGYPVGTLPEDVKDPALRAAYATAIMENQKLLDINNALADARHLQTYWYAEAEAFLRRMYSEGAADPNELEKLLDNAGIKQAETRSKIISFSDAKGVPPGR